MTCNLSSRPRTPSKCTSTPPLLSSPVSSTHSLPSPVEQAPSSMAPQPCIPTERVLLKDIALLWTGEDDRLLTGCSIVVDSGIIQWVGPHDRLPTSLRASPCTTVDMSACLVTPGLVNTHHHMYQSLTKCFARDSSLFDWLQTLFPVWNFLTADMVYKSARFAIAELLLSGCTLTSDLLYLYPNDVRLDDTIRAAKELGIRFHPCRGAVSVGESDGGLPPDTLVEDETHILRDMRRLIDRYHDERDGAMVRIALAPCSPFSVSEQLMKKTARLARSHKKVMLHTHFAENSADIEYMRTNVQKGLVEFLEHCGWNQSDCWFAHCVKLGDDDDDGRFESSLEYFARRKLGVSHCPTSNCRLGSGVAPVSKMVKLGIPVSIGVDGSASNDSGNMLAEARMALMVARVKEESADALSTSEVLRMATSGGATVLGRDDVGRIRAGMCADVAAWRLDAPAFAGSFHSHEAVLSALILGNGGDLKAEYVMVNGVEVVRAGELSGEKGMVTITREHQEAAMKLWAIASEQLRRGVP
eukprot:TRINITY_DN1489_c0_g1_i1.p1 TRINITY_DN1489_c0_g1~~TRINITY_DN1489_c0_g1_i1.p1  ORF type:complete len:528 (-),score=81.15 TRINITY_DN1489_c0_g1_i1:811-2394(-)